jgi:hypothetical protein
MIGRTIGAFLICLALIASAFASEPGKQAVDVLLVLAADVSRSIDDQEFALQRQGYASAITNARVLKATRSGHHRRIAVAFVEWSDEQDVVIDWTLIDGDPSARVFADQLTAKRRSPGTGTAIGSAIRFAAGLIETAPFTATRKIIDISGDGTSNSGWDVAASRDVILAKDKDLVINGLVILSDEASPWNPEHTHPPGGLENYYRKHVVGGPGAFVMVAQSFNTFGRAIVSKMVTEIAALR